MSFSSDVKKELCAMELENSCCKKAEIFGFMQCCRDGLVLNTGNNGTARRYAREIVDCFHAIVDISVDLVYKNGKRHFSVSIPDDSERGRIISLFDDYLPKERCCKVSALRGAFLAGGTITNPQKDYHVEISAFTQNHADTIYSLLSDLGINAKITQRSTSYSVYIKGSEQIEDFLGMIGALDSYWKILEVVVEKDIRNKANRAANCDAANIGRTVAAASKQVDAILKIKEKTGFDNLPDELREIAEIRLENPELSLREIGAMLSSPISRSGVNHRLQKLVEMAQDL